MIELTNTFKTAIKREATNLRRYATEEQKKKLSADKVVPTDKTACIYGLMTGDCYSKEATKLLKLCGVPAISTYNPLSKEETIFNPTSKWKKEAWGTELTHNGRSYSAIEGYLVIANRDKVRQLVKYIKGGSDALSL
jgi:hypothetical protein